MLKRYALALTIVVAVVSAVFAGRQVVAVVAQAHESIPSAGSPTGASPSTPDGNTAGPSGAVSGTAARVVGTVSAVNGSTYSLTLLSGGWRDSSAGTMTVQTDSGTAIVDPQASGGSAGSIAVGATLIADGTVSSDGQTLHATRIVVFPPSVNPYGGSGTAPFDPGNDGGGTNGSHSGQPGDGQSI